MTGAHFDCDEEFKNINSGFPLLESFTMIDCDLVDRRHQYFKVLVLEKYEDWAGQVKTKISIDAPILVSFGYHSRHALLQIVVNSPNLLDATITLDFFWNVHRMEWYVNILNFLSCLDSSRSMSFSLHSEQALIFPENLRKLVGSSPLPNLKHLKVKTSCELERESDLEKALRWLSPSLETLSIEHKKTSLTNM